MTRSIRQASATVLAIMLAVVLSGSTAFAFECYNASRSAKGNESAARSQALASPSLLLVAFCGLTQEEAQDVLDTLEGEGYDTSILINIHAFMAGGLQLNGDKNGLLHNGKGIDHLSHDFFERLLELVPGCEEQEPE